uniref:Uncharacterized protein n=1 Tax=Anguilla anguilla TaxID=7936 RepID=A0A0E9Q3C7_ANGAN
MIPLYKQLGLLVSPQFKSFEHY